MRTFTPTTARRLTLVVVPAVGFACYAVAVAAAGVDWPHPVAAAAPLVAVTSLWAFAHWWNRRDRAAGREVRTQSRDELLWQACAAVVLITGAVASAALAQMLPMLFAITLVMIMYFAGPGRRLGVSPSR